MLDNDGAAGLGHNLPEIEYDDLRELLDALSDKKRSVDESNGKLRAALKGIIDDRGFHAGGFATIRKIDAMSETERADFLRTFNALYTAMKAGKWDQESSDLLSATEAEEKIADAAASPPVEDATKKKGVKKK